MATPQFNFNGMYEKLKGNISVGDINITYDFTNGMSETEWIAKIERRANDDYFVCKSGKIIMPKLGII